MRIDLHCHSEASADCRTPLAAFPGRCKARGITVQAITDHNEIWGAQQLQEMTLGSELTVIVGEEVSSRDGEIIGLFLREKIPAGLSAEETVERIKAQGGLVLLPHGFDPLKRYRLTRLALERIAGQIDIVGASMPASPALLGTAPPRNGPTSGACPRALAPMPTPWPTSARPGCRPPSARSAPPKTSWLHWAKAP